MVTVHRLPGAEDPFAIVIDSAVSATASVSADGLAVTVVLRADGRMPCALIFPEEVAVQVFGADYWATFEHGPGLPDRGDR